MLTEQEKLEAAWLDGFMSSAEGYNGEYPFYGDPTPELLERVKAEVAALFPAVTSPPKAQDEDHMEIVNLFMVAPDDKSDAPKGEEEPVAWRAMDSAPDDGTPILIERETEFETEERWHVVRWDDHDGAGGWWVVHDGKNDHVLRGPDPLRWLPLDGIGLSRPNPVSAELVEAAKEMADKCDRDPFAPNPDRLRAALSAHAGGTV